MIEEIITKLTTEDEVRKFIAAHSGEIRGLYKDKYFKLGGWNGLMDALTEVEEKYKVEIWSEELFLKEDNSPDNDYPDENLFERILREEI